MAADFRFIVIGRGMMGAAAKSSDELGRLGAQLLLSGTIDEEGYEPVFSPHFL